jgi:hypothetical protein
MITLPTAIWAHYLGAAAWSGARVDDVLCPVET